MENTAGMINLPKVTESYVADSRPVNSEGGNLELLWRIRPFINTHEIKSSDPLLLGDSQGESRSQREAGTPKCGGSHPGTVSSWGAPVRSRNRRGTGLRGRGVRAEQGEARSRDGKEVARAGGLRRWGRGRRAGGGASAHPPRPYLVREQLLLSGAGAGDPGRIHVPAARRGSARRPPPLPLHTLLRDGRPGGVGGGGVTGTACLRHLLPPPPLRLSLPAPAPGAAAAAAAAAAASGRPGPAPPSPPPRAPIRPGTTPHVTAQPGPQPGAPSLGKAELQPVCQLAPEIRPGWCSS
ncbi:translation initiation factor IF-2-like [Mustela erminea]|uniref:translation initiation factor IF-2-like n=1 Tax=Mustela erminea TaxID=36723 RepID=UPI001386BEBC|nr:translation initiation factor IF-2-like [Mustela erminea]